MGHLHSYKTVILFAFCIVLNVIDALSQQSRIDSLEKLFPEITDEKHKIKILNDLCFTYYPVDPKKGAEYGEQAIELAH